jgi:hypothetical protein
MTSTCGWCEEAIDPLEAETIWDADGREYHRDCKDEMVWLGVCWKAVPA